MTGLFSQPSPPAPKPAVIAAPTRSAAEVEAAADAERRRLAGLTGRGSTVLTARNDTMAPAGGKVLLGAG